MPLKQENWDSVTAPAIPGGWTVDSGLVTTSTFAGGITPTSSPNALGVLIGGNNTHRFATWGTRDTNNGDTTVQANFNASGITNNLTFGLFLRCNVSAAVLSSSTFYWYQLSPNAQVSRIYKVVAGTQTFISSVSFSSWSEPAWYTATLTSAGTQITASVQRQSDGFWLNSSGTFQSGQTNVNSVTDSSISGAGFAGLSLQARSDDAYTDDWLFENAAPLSLTPYMRPVRREVRGPLFSKLYG